jgi:molecular chaperone GrpE (heat shock protein)
MPMMMLSSLSVGSTHKMMLKVFERNGLSMINPIGDKFDPNQV